MSKTKPTTTGDIREIKGEVMKHIIILYPINIWGKIAFRLMRFAGWLFQVTGNKYEKK
jgi:hypothetical protein